ncbi:Ankyrin-1 [Hondaea fermentalgiana]|uniref:Ankyrin-1 n=1 Tax=Hondaea fermentalgiana TaxID=2315210 RepID=A0A2R5G8Z5_9STRA|nr:Ankyrin-1 [Hondaea fermentalgiana]|eukprot:GBG24134.1 Ankyrin-1 [Hondaea fermentalgiana]
MDELSGEPDASKALTDESVFEGWPALLWGREKELAERLMSAVEDGDTHKADVVLDEYCAAFPEKAMAILNVRKTNQRCEFPLAIAASLNDVSTMQLLISRGCCLRCQTASNESALHFAAITGSLDAVELLLDKGLTEFLFVPSSSAGDLLVDQVLDELTDCVESNESDAAVSLEAVALRILDAGPHCARETAERVSAVAWDSICADLQESLADVVARARRNRR